MSFRPSQDKSIQKQLQNSFWQAVEDVFDNTVQLESLPRNDWEELKRSYITDRRFDEYFDIDAMKSRLPRGIDKLNLGPKEIDLVGFLLNYDKDRSLILEGPRGSGKTSLLHFVEAAINSTGYKNSPILIIVNCLKIQRDFTESDLINILKEAIKTSLDFADEPIKSALLDSVSLLNKNKSFAGAREAFTGLFSTLSTKNFKRIFVVFDNLDHNFLGSIVSSIELAKELHISSKVATITTVRPGCLEAIYSRGNARAFFNCKIKLSAPTTLSIIENLAKRLRENAEKYLSSTKKSIRAYNLDIKPENLETAIQKLIDLLKGLRPEGRRPEDDVLFVLDAVAADDIRHLLLLLRRLLSSRRLPGKWLLNIDEEYPSFHPLVALFEGDWLTFIDNSAIPNLLSFVDSEGNDDFLISHRILLLLSTSSHRYPMSGSKIVGLLLRLGHKRQTIIECLSSLHEYLLIRSTNAEFIDPDGPLPKAFFLTESGAIYLTKLLHTTDYLISAVLDVRLKHEKFKAECNSRSKNIPFSVQISSLLEYVYEIILAEEAQIKKIIDDKHSVDQLFLLDVFRKGGLICNCLKDGLEDAYSRSFLGDAQEIRDLFSDLVDKIRELNGFIENLENMMTSTYLLKIRTEDLTSKTIHIGEDADLVLSPIGNDVEISANLKAQRSCQSALVSVSGKIDNKYFAISTVAGAAECKPGTNIVAKFAKILGAATANFEALQPQALLDVCKLGNRVALLTTDNPDGNTFHLRFHVFNPDGCGCEIYDIGRDVSIKDLQEISNNIIKEVGNAAKSNTLNFEMLNIHGTKLAKMTMTPDGQNILASHYESIDILMLFAAESDVSIPWEWIRPQPLITHTDVEMICQAFKVIRWPTSSSSDIISGITRLKVIEEKNCIGNVITIGRKVDRKSNWIKKVPDSIGQLQNILHDFDTLHMIGHYSKDENCLKMDNFKINLDAIDAYPLIGPKNIIISACGSAAEVMNKNIPVSLSLQSHAIVGLH